MFDCTVWSTRAAAEKLPTSDTTMRAFSLRRSIAKHDGTYRKQLVDGLLAHLYLDGQHEEASHPPGTPSRASRGRCPPVGPPHEAERRPSPRAGVSASPHRARRESPRICNRVMGCVLPRVSNPTKETVHCAFPEPHTPGSAHPAGAEIGR